MSWFPPQGKKEAVSRKVTFFYQFFIIKLNLWLEEIKNIYKIYYKNKLILYSLDLITNIILKSCISYSIPLIKYSLTTHWLSKHSLNTLVSMGHLLLRLVFLLLRCRILICNIIIIGFWVGHLGICGQGSWATIDQYPSSNMASNHYVWNEVGILFWFFYWPYLNDSA